MPNLKRTILLVFALLFLPAATACGAIQPRATPTPSPTATPTLTPPPATPVWVAEEMQMPKLPDPALAGNFMVEKTRAMHYACFGEGSPTVLIEAGAGDQPTISGSWNAVILGVSPLTRICVYDRVNVSTSQKVAENLHLLLTSIPIPGPYIVVAHSLGGWHGRLFAHLYPDETVGMVLVDTTNTTPEAGIMYATAYPTYSPGEPEDITQFRFSETDIYQPHMESMEGLEMSLSNEQVRQAGTFGDLPLVVICHTLGQLELVGLDPSFQAQYAAIFVMMQADLANLSTQGVFIEASTNQHFISEYQPQIIIDAVNRMVEQVRK